MNRNIVTPDTTASETQTGGTPIRGHSSQGQRDRGHAENKKKKENRRQRDKLCLPKSCHCVSEAAKGGGTTKSPDKRVKEKNSIKPDVPQS